MSDLSFTSSAKINLGLQIQAVLDNGYHQVRTIMAKIPFTDRLTLTWLESGEENQVICADPNVPNNSNNLILRAFSLLDQDFSLPPAKIILTKNIPLGSGLAGGSFNAGVLLTTLNQRLHLNLSVVQIQNYALQLGADVPFAAQEHSVIQEVNHGLPTLQPTVLPNLPACQIALFLQNFSLDTQKLYRSYDQDFSLHQAVEKSHAGDWPALCQALQSQTLLPIAAHLFNDFSPLVFRLYPHLRILQKQLLGAGALGVNLTGKGPTLFALFPPQTKLDFTHIDSQLYQEIKIFSLP